MRNIVNLESITTPISDVAALNCFFKFNEISTDTEITDAVTGATAAVVANATVDENAYFTGRINGAALSANIPAPGAGADFIAFGLFNPLAGAVRLFQLGGSAAHRIVFATNGCLVAGAGGVSSSLGNLATALRKVAIVANASGNTTLYQAAIGDSLLSGAGTPVAYSSHGDLTTDFAALSMLGSIPDGNFDAYGFQLLSFAGGSLPSDIITAADWTMEQAYRDNKTIYPRLAEV